MNEDRKTFNINPGTGMIDVIGHSGYTFDFAIADLIDNCISANANKIILHFNPDPNHPFIYIIDDGDGMTIDELKNAAIIGYKDINEIRNVDDLGRFSTGLKSATKSFCNKITVASKKYNSKVNAIEIDFDHITKSKKWEAYEINNFALNKKIEEKGTLVLCENFNFNNDFLFGNAFYDKLDNLQISLSHIFSKFLLEKKIQILIEIEGSKPIEIIGWNPFSLPENESTKVVYHDEFEYKNEKIKIKAYILPTFSNLSPNDQKYMAGKGLLEQEGFYVYRNNRLIQEGGWLSLPDVGMDDKSKYARIEVNIPSALDKEFQINFSKNTLIIPKDIETKFVIAAKKARKESRNNFDYQKHPQFKRTTKKDEERIWKQTSSNQGLVLSVNFEHPLIKELSQDMPIIKLKRLLNVLSKSLPITLIQSQETTTISYTQEEICELLEETYQKFKSDGMNDKDIKTAIAKAEPFKEYLNWVIEFFDRKENQ